MAAKDSNTQHPCTSQISFTGLLTCFTCFKFVTPLAHLFKPLLFYKSNACVLTYCRAVFMCFDFLWLLWFLLTPLLVLFTSFSSGLRYFCWPVSSLGCDFSCLVWLRCGLRFEFGGLNLFTKAYLHLRTPPANFVGKWNILKISWPIRF